MSIPDCETRVAILRRKAEERGVTFQPGGLETVAGAECANVRELMGALNRLVAYQAVNEAPINAEAAKQLLGITPAAGPTLGRPTRGGAGGGGGAPGGEPAPPAEFPAFPPAEHGTGGKGGQAWRAPPP